MHPVADFVEANSEWICRYESWQRGGVVASQGERWRQNRKLAFTKLLSKHRIQSMEPKITEEMRLFRVYADRIAQEGTAVRPNSVVRIPPGYSRFSL